MAISPKHILRHLKRLLLILGPCMVAVVVLGLMLAKELEGGSAVNHLRAECVGDALRFYANGELLGEASDPTLAEGDVALVVMAPATGAHSTAYFDDLVIARPDDGKPTPDWTTYDTTDGTAGYVRERFRIISHGTGIPLFSRAGQSLGDAIITATVRSAGGIRATWAGIACRYRDHGNGYAFLVNRHGEYMITRLAGGESTPLAGPARSDQIRIGPTDSPLAHVGLAALAVVPILLALVGVPLLAAHFLRDLYDIRTPGEAYAFLSRILFGSWAFGPYLLIKEGKVARGNGTILHRVGGPGYLVIYNDTVVITERGGRLERLLGTGFPFLERFEKVWEVIDLRPQRWVYEVSAMTRDGIPVTCEADVSFQIDDRVADESGNLQPQQPTSEEPYPYAREAVFRAATSRWIRDPDWKGPPMDWAGRVVIGFTEGILRNILAEYRLDWLLAPTGSDSQIPREAIRKRLEEELEKEAPRVGAKILRVDLGEIRVKDEEISRQWLEAWQAEWESRALITRTEGEAEFLRMDIAQARAQAEMVLTLTQALQSVATSEAELRPYLLATRFVEALRWMSFDPFTRVCMPPEAMQTLRRLQELLDGQDLSPGRQTRRSSEEGP